MLIQALVTGGTGFIGQALVSALLRDGVSVRVMVRPPTLAAKPEVIGRLKNAGATFVIGDVLDTKSTGTAVGGASHVFHLAGHLQEPGFPREAYEALHVEGTRNVMLACAQQRHRPVVVHCSTAGVLGSTGPAPALESAPGRPTTDYEITKRHGEQEARELARQFDIPLVVVRPSLVYGPGDYHLLGWFRAIYHRYFHVIGSGLNLVHPIFVGDVVEGLIACAANEAALGGVYHLVGRRALPMREMAEAIARAFGRQLPRTRIPVAMAQCLAAVLEAAPGVPAAQLPLTKSRINFMVESRAYCGRRITQELGFLPAVELAHGLRQTVEWYRSEGLL